MYDLIMSHLDSLVTRKSGKVVYYNEQNQFGNISVYQYTSILQALLQVNYILHLHMKGILDTCTRRSILPQPILTG